MDEQKTDRVMNKEVKKVILTRVEELPMAQKMEHGLKGRAVIEVTKNSPIEKKTVKIDGNYSDYFEEKFNGGQMSSEQIRQLGEEF